METVPIELCKPILILRQKGIQVEGVQNACCTNACVQHAGQNVAIFQTVKSLKQCNNSVNRQKMIESRKIYNRLQKKCMKSLMETKTSESIKARKNE